MTLKTAASSGTATVGSWDVESSWLPIEWPLECPIVLILRLPKVGAYMGNMFEKLLPDLDLRRFRWA